SGGVTVQILPGTYKLRNSVYPRSNIRLQGSGPETILVKEASVASKLAADSDWYDQEITLCDDKGFRVGDGVCLRARNLDNGGTGALKRTPGAPARDRLTSDYDPP